MRVLKDDIQNVEILQRKISELEETIQSLKEKLSLSELALKSLDNCTDPILWTDKNNRFIYSNKAASDLLGYSREEFLAMSVSDIDSIMKMKDTDTYRKDLEATVDERGRLRAYHTSKSGRIIPVEVTGTRLSQADSDYDIAFCRDISDRLEYEQKLLRMNEDLSKKNSELRNIYDELNQLYEEITASEEELRVQNDQLSEQQEQLVEKNMILQTIITASSDGIWYRNIKTGQHIFPTSWLSNNKLGLVSKSPIHVSDWEKLIHPEDAVFAMQQLKDLTEGKTSNFESIYRVKTDNNQYIWIRTRAMSIRDESGVPIIITGVNSDISEIKNNEEQLKDQAFYDSLTGLPNRTLLIERLNTAIRMSKRNSSKTAILFIDIDNFKKVNDTIGHNFGDELLKEAARRISSQIRDYDTAARFGGDEFVILFHEISDPEQVLELSHRIRNCILEPFIINKTSFHLSCSIGVTICPDDGSTTEELLKNADVAMYKAKDAGKDKVRFYDQRMKDASLSKIIMENDLRLAASKMSFTVHFQPQFDLRDNSMRGAELLLRWNNPRSGNVPPNVFIPIAEETGLIVPIGNWVLEQACLTAAKWKQQYSFDGIFSVNISPVQLRNRNFVKTVQKCITASGIEPSCLELEITESLFIDSMDAAVSKLSALRKLGVRISLDDFGTGYSSLSYLRNLPINTLKVDKCFIDEISEEGSKSMTSAIIALVRELEIETIAEGVETDLQYSYLKGAGCDFVQGFLTGKPIPEDQLCLLIEKELSKNV
ncbi:MAG: EAL domain-containing protein [Clostridiales bacterium]|nr:EAL domain-containing protein [Clostridiales bacterium]